MYIITSGEFEILNYILHEVLFKENGGEVLGVESQTEHSFVRNWLLNFDIERQVASYRDQTLLY